ncbi:hypothetical protein J437_LFUL002425 [Ladona fulva]|uniref:Peptidase S1 domain-containing protein n=1 Tax=Ladona fulva TaxID=123851 RepID=A0A8K0P976_LADFU|nr:hypothetical protein J437_LFUL002425 [Ladona fulva]
MLSLTFKMKLVFAVTFLAVSAHALDVSKLKPVEVKRPPLHPKLSAAGWNKVDTSNYKKGTNQQPGVINFIRLPPPSFASVNLDGQLVTISGFGKYTDDSGISKELRYVTLPVMPTAQCAGAFPGVDNSQICTDTTGGHSACNGDSGGPLIIQVNDGGYYEVGLVSFGSNQGCTLGMPAVFTRITRVINFIRLPPPSFASVNLDGQLVTISGFGKYTDDSGISKELRYVTLPVMPTAQCAGAFPGVDNSQICTDTTGGHSACNGDSGGPLIIQVNDGGYYEVGLVSFGSNQGCTLGMPAVFTRITSFLPWISSHTGMKF